MEFRPIRCQCNLSVQRPRAARGLRFQLQLVVVPSSQDAKGPRILRARCLHGGVALTNVPSVRTCAQVPVPSTQYPVFQLPVTRSQLLAPRAQKRRSPSRVQLKKNVINVFLSR